MQRRGAAGHEGVRPVPRNAHPSAPAGDPVPGVSKIWNLCKMNIKIEISVRRVAKGKFKKARFYADFRVSQSPKKSNRERRKKCLYSEK